MSGCICKLRTEGEEKSVLTSKWTRGQEWGVNRSVLVLHELKGLCFPPFHFKTQPQNLLHWNTLHKIQVTLCILFLGMPRICLHERRENVKSLSRVQLFVTPWTVAYQAPPSMGFSRREYCNGLPLPFPGDLPDAGVKPGPPTLQTDALPSEPPGKPICL